MTATPSIRNLVRIAFEAGEAAVILGGTMDLMIQHDRLQAAIAEVERELNEARNEVAITHAANEKLMEELAYYHKLEKEARR